MHFESVEDEARFNRDLIRFSNIAEHSFSISGGLIKKGLRLLKCEFGGVLQEVEGSLDSIYERFEVELLKERYGSLTIFANENLTWLGYRSEFLDRLLDDVSLSRDILEDLSRSESIDALVDAEPWAWRYRRVTLEHWRSVAQREIVSREKHHEFQLFNLAQSIDPTKAKQRLEKFVAEKFAELGYRKSGKRYGKFKFPVYANAARVKRGVPIEFICEIDATPVRGLPISLNLRCMPVLDLSGANALLVQCMQRGNFFKLIEPLVPNFGVYRVAWDSEQFELMLHAYNALLDACIPLIESVCEDLKRPL